MIPSMDFDELTRLIRRLMVVPVLVGEVLPQAESLKYLHSLQTHCGRRV